MRELPDRGIAGAGELALVPTSSDRRLFQGEYGDVFGNHRLKSQMRLQTESRFLDDAGLERTFLSAVERHYADHGTLTSRSGSPEAWPGARFDMVERFGIETLTQTWDEMMEQGSTRFEIEMSCPEPGTARSQFSFSGISISTSRPTTKTNK